MTASGLSNWSFRSIQQATFLDICSRTNYFEHCPFYDGQRSHIFLDLSEWAKNNNIVMSDLPPYSSHILQPWDVGCFGSFKFKFKEFLSFSRPTHNTVTHYDFALSSAKHKLLQFCIIKIQYTVFFFLKPCFYPSKLVMYHNYPIKYISWSSVGNKVLPNSLVNANDEAIVKVYEKQTGQNAQKLRQMRLLGFFFLHENGYRRRESWQCDSKPSFLLCE